MSENLIETNGAVTERGETKSKRPKFKIGGQWYFCDNSLETFPSVGMTVELRYSLFGDQNDLRSMKSWRVPQAGQTSPPASNVAAPATVPPAPTDADSLRFISNVIGSACTAGTIKSPTQIHGWFEAAKLALTGKPFTPNDNY